MRRIASRTSSACGTTHCSIAGANGSGANFAPTRSIGGVEPVEHAACWMTAASSAPNPPRVTASCAVTHRVVLRTELTIVSSSSGSSVPVYDLDGDALALGSCGCLERLVREATRRHHGHVLTLAVHTRLAERNRLELVRNLALDRVQRAVLEEHDGVVVVDRGPSRPRGVLGRGREHDLEARDVDEPGLELLRVLGRPAGPALGPMVSGTFTWPPDIVRCLAPGSGCSIEA